MDIAGWLRIISQQLAVLSTKDLTSHVKECERSLEHAVGFGCFTDPTAWIKANTDGSMEDCRLQLDIAKHLLAARKAIDAREEFIKTKASSSGEQHESRGRRT